MGSESIETRDYLPSRWQFTTIILCSARLLQKPSRNVRVMLIDMGRYCNSACAQNKKNISDTRKFGLYCQDWRCLSICLLSVWLAGENLNENLNFQTNRALWALRAQELCLRRFVSMLANPFPLVFLRYIFFRCHMLYPVTGKVRCVSVSAGSTSRFLFWVEREFSSSRWSVPVFCALCTVTEMLPVGPNQKSVKK